MVQVTEMALVQSSGSALISAPIETHFTGDDGFCPVITVIYWSISQKEKPARQAQT